MKKNGFSCLMALLMACMGLHAQVSEKYSYGMKLGVNYTMIGASSSTYGGTVMPTIGMFWASHITDRLTFSVDPAFSAVRFRQQQSDTRYNTNYIEASFNATVYPSAMSTDFAFLFGLRPSALLVYSTEVFSGGSYQKSRDETNLNRSGRIDLTGIIGLSVALSPVVNFELIYAPSFTNANGDLKIEGRPSTLEVGLRLNAVSIRDQVKKSQQSTRDLIQHYSKGALLVMLQTPNPSEINALRKDRNENEILSIENELKLRNNLVVKKFREQFSFCPVYFFMDTNAYKLLSHNYEGIFLNDQLQPDPGITIDTSNFFVASFCVDNSNYTNRMHFGLYVYDSRIVQLDKPFNHPTNLVSEMVEGDPILFVTRKRTNYSKANFARIIAKFNTRLMRYMN